MNYVTSYQHEDFRVEGFTRAIVVQGTTLMDIFAPMPDMTDSSGIATFVVIVNDVLEQPLVNTTIKLDCFGAATELREHYPDWTDEKIAETIKVTADRTVTETIVRCCYKALAIQADTYGVELDPDMEIAMNLHRIGKVAMNQFVMGQLMDAALDLDEAQFADLQESALGALSLVDGLRDRLFGEVK